MNSSFYHITEMHENEKRILKGGCFETMSLQRAVIRSKKECEGRAKFSTHSYDINHEKKRISLHSFSYDFLCELSSFRFFHFCPTWLCKHRI